MNASKLCKPRLALFAIYSAVILLGGSDARADDLKLSRVSLFSSGVGTF